MFIRKTTIAMTMSLLFFTSGNLLAGLASANYNYINDLVGDRAMGLGGAYAAMSDDPSGAYYNPAGLAFAFDNQISLSVNTYKGKNIVYKNAVWSNNDYNQNISAFYPSFFGVVQTIGKAKFALVFININNEILDQDDRYNNIKIPETGPTRDVIADTYINYNNTDNTFLFGLSTGFFLNKKTSLGFSLFALSRKREQIFNQMNVIVDDPAAVYTAGDIYITNKYRTDKFFGMLGKFGIQWMPMNKIAFGLTVGGGGFFSHYNQTQTLQNGVITSSKGYVSGSALPVEVRAGVAYFPSNKFLITADVIGDFGTTYYDTEVKNTINGALGAEYYITDIMPVRLGLFTNFANTPEIVNSKTGQDMHVDLYGVSTSISLQSRNSSITLSGFYQYGIGKTQIGTDINKTETTTVQNYQIALTGTAKY
ncbi:MAG: hypothetical protein ABUK01_17025 [Leptospirales bacterium]